MSKVTCDVCGREIDSRGLSGHMKTHGRQEHEQEDKPVDKPVDNGVIVIEEADRFYPAPKKPVKKPAASNQTSKSDPRGEKNAGAKRTGHPKGSGVKEPEKKEWEGLFR